HRQGGRYGYVYGGEERLRLFQGWLGSAARVLDLGCRDGALTGQWAAGKQVVGVDIDRTALGRARDLFGLRGVQGNLNESFPFAWGSFDAVVAGELLEHVFFPDFFLEEVGRVLRPDGRFIGSTPNAFRLRNRWRFLRGQEFESDPTHLHRYSVSGLEQALGRHFGRVRVEPLGGHFLGGGRSGIPVRSGAPCWARRLFALDLCWLAEGPLDRHA
ncbi:MAG: class I SAM-dependent methyltransferase, partial [Candidatus Methylomirabilota bacterium]